MNVDDFEDAEEAAKYGLLALMGGLSEEHYAAGWISGNEITLWKAAPGTAYGMGEITERQATLLRLLSEEAGGWWRWNGDCPLFVTLAEWEERLAKMRELEDGK